MIVALRRWRNMKIDPIKNLELLKDEYIQLQNFYEDVDKRALTIKGWNVTIAIAAIGAGFLVSPHLWFIAALASIVFWYLEAFWRAYHFFLSTRIKEIEKSIREDTWENFYPLQLYTTWTNTFNKYGAQTKKYFLKPVTIQPHLSIFLVCIIFYLLWIVKIIEMIIKKYNW